MSDFVIKNEYNYQESYDLGFNLVKTNFNCKDFGYKNKKFTELLEKLRDNSVDIAFIDGINNSLEENHNQGNFLKLVVTSFNGYKFYYMINNFIDKVNFSEVILDAPYVNIIHYLKKRELFKYFNPNKLANLNSLGSIPELFSEMALLNNDDRVFNWGIKVLKSIMTPNLDNYVVSALSRPFLNQKYYLRRLKLLGNSFELSHLYFILINKRLNLTWKLFTILTEKYYHPIKSKIVWSSVHYYNILINKDYKKRLEYIKTKYSFEDYNLLKQLLFDSIQDLRYVTIEEESYSSVKPFFEHLIKDKSKNQIIRFIQGLNYYCFYSLKKNLLPLKTKLVSLLRNLYLKYHIDNFESHPYIILIVRPHHEIPIHYLRMNLLGTQLRIFMKKKYNHKIKVIKEKLKDINNEIITFEPNPQIPVLSLGSRHYQIKNSSYYELNLNDIKKLSLIPLKNIIPNEFKDNIHTKMLSSIQPFKINMLIKAILIEDTMTYLVYDINLPNMTYLERIEYLRQIHPRVKYTTIPYFETEKDLKEYTKNETDYIDKLSFSWYPMPIMFLNKKNII